MTGDVRYDRLILLMDDDELEMFCRAWTEKKSGYVEVKRFAGTGDMGRDVAGFLTDKRHDGAWDNYQCKQYRKPELFNSPIETGVRSVVLLNTAYQRPCGSARRPPRLGVF